MVHLDPIYVGFVGQDHRSKFKVTGGNVPFQLKVRVSLGKPATGSAGWLADVAEKADLNWKLSVSRRTFAVVGGLV